ncbi:MAG: ribonuclease HI [Gemmatimonadetes bacterium]|nr:ribonuclease HI [Gemmatimonadota bacterium]
MGGRTDRRTGGQRIVVHADEACLGNGTEPPNPGGAGGLVEAVRRSGGQAVSIERRDYFLSEPNTTNNRMALRSASAALGLLGAKGRRLTIAFVSDSQYLVTGMSEWVPNWRARGWRRKRGEIENLELWQELVSMAQRHDITWRWVRGHAGHPKNEYANFLATRAAKEQRASDGLVASDFEKWLEREREKGKYADYDPETEPA